MWHKAMWMGTHNEKEMTIVVIYKAFCLDVAQGHVNGDT